MVEKRDFSPEAVCVVTGPGIDIWRVANTWSVTGSGVLTVLIDDVPLGSYAQGQYQEVYRKGCARQYSQNLPAPAYRVFYRGPDGRTSLLVNEARNDR